MPAYIYSKNTYRVSTVYLAKVPRDERHRGVPPRGRAVNEPDWDPWGLGFDPWPRSVG